MISTGYLDFPKNMNEFGKFIFLRTYSRWKEEEQRRETFYEMAQRVAEYNVSFDTSLDRDARNKEIQDIIDAMMQLQVFPAGRSMWIGGTKAAEQTKLANFNCSFKVIDSFNAFVEGFYLLLCGAGFGFRVLPKDINQLPHVNAQIVLANKPYNPKDKWERREDTAYFDGDGTRLIVVGDSKQGWVDALRYYFDALLKSDLESIIVNYDSVRPKGEELKTFGGRASGHEALRDMFRKIHTVITKETEQARELHYLRPINAMDIMNIIGEGVVVGGKISYASN
jgi:ribonucleoside-diphosphate reductase alpha chain/ribonucleoside-triphosphate reductase